MLILGIWGSSKKDRMLKEAKAKAKFDKLVEEEKNKWFISNYIKKDGN